MPVFVWEGRTRTGEETSGVMEADNDGAVTAALRAQQITVTKIKRRMGDIRIQIGTGVKPKDVVIFTRQLATMIDAGLPLVQCLEILGNQAENKNFGRIVHDVRGRVEGGATFSDALRGHPKIFDDLYVNLVAAGEIGGILDTILNRLVLYIEKALKLKARVKGALVYPISILLISIVVVVVLLWKVIPVFEKMFMDMGAGSLPALTQMAIDLSRGFVSNAPILLVGAIALVVGWTLTMRTYQGKRAVHAVLLKFPIIGPVWRKVVVARFTRTFGTLLSSGVPILDAMDIVAATAGNLVVKEAILHVKDRVSEGKDLATPLMETKVFPPMVVQMIGVGEQTGAMDQMLQKIADFYEEEVDVAVAALTSLLEPLMMVVLGGIVGFILIAMYLPIFELAGAIKAE